MKSIKRLFAFLFAFIMTIFGSSQSLADNAGIPVVDDVTGPYAYYNPGRRGKFKACIHR